MKKEMNHAFEAKKKNYINPEVSVAQFACTNLMQAASPAGGGGTNPDVNIGIPTDDQW